MSGSVPDTSNWKAVEDRQPPGVRLKVTGTVTTTRSNQEPQLTKAVPQGINPAMLLLDLSIETSGNVGSDVMGKRDVEYEEEIKAGQYTSIHIRFASKGIKTIDEITIIH
jgi:hypothetical protein